VVVRIANLLGYVEDEDGSVVERRTEEFGVLSNGVYEHADSGREE
jgi:hypothetical protein